MFKRGTIKGFDDFFKKSKERTGKEVYAYRFCQFNEKILDFLMKYYSETRRRGVILEGKIPNPTEQNLSYYEEMMGLEFRMDVKFFLQQLQRWLPRLDQEQRDRIAMAMYDGLMDMHRQGKNLNILKNAYIKFMCWLYYRFERILVFLGKEEIPKILCERDPGNYGLRMLDILSRAGCDMILLQYEPREGCGEISEIFTDYVQEGMSSFPEGFGIRQLGEEQQRRQNLAMLYGERPQIFGEINTWSQKKGMEAALEPVGSRGTEPNKFYHCFWRITGVEDPVTYMQDLFRFYEQMRQSGRKILILDQTIPQPSVEEIGEIRRQPYKTIEQMLSHLSGNIRCGENPQLEQLINQTFIDIMMEKFEKEQGNLQRLANKAVYLLCWIRRYQKILFQGWKLPELACVIDFGGCRNENEALFLKFLSKLPTDLLIFVPDQSRPCCLQAPELLELHYDQSMEAESFPTEHAMLRMGTAAYYAERELDTLMYQDSGMYRERQHKKANVVNLQTMYEEIRLLWDEELKYRPNFQVVQEVVTMPVICSKISGVKDGDLARYWEELRNLNTADTVLVTKLPWFQGPQRSSQKMNVTEFLKNGRLQKKRIKDHRLYPYGFLREAMQNHILEKLELLINQKIIKGTFENGTEYAILSTVLNLPKQLLQLIQKLDFTKKNPKIMIVHTTEQCLSLEDSILTAFLNLVGFDVLFFVPTGYRSVEGFFQKNIMEEHEIGEYLYDLNVPDLSADRGRAALLSWKEKIFKRGN